MLRILVADIQVILYVYLFHFPFFFIPDSRVFIIIYETENQIIIISDLRDIVHCHSIHMILFQHPDFVTALVQVILYVYHYFFKTVFTDFLYILLIFMNNQMQPFE